MTAHCRTCRCDPLSDKPPQPGRSNGAHRRAVIAGAKQVIDSKRRARTSADAIAAPDNAEEAS